MVVEVPLRNVIFFTLRRQHLLQRADRDSAIRVIEDILGLNAQGALHYNLSLWNRVEGLDRGFIKSAVLDKRLLRSWLMRNTVHIMPRELAHLTRAALRESLVSEWNRWTVKTGSKEKQDSWEKHYAGVLETLKNGPLTMSEIFDRMRMGVAEKRIMYRVVREMSLKGLICNAASRGPWYHDTENTFADISRWAPSLEKHDPAEAKAALLLRYLQGYGPASVQDFSYWTGMKVSEAKQILEDVGPALAEVKAESQRGKLYLIKDDLSDLEAVEAEPSLRLLPKFDPLIMGHRDKTRIMGMDARRRVFLPTAEVSATMLLNGRVEGVWSIRKLVGAWQLDLNPPRRLDGEAEEMLHDEIKRMEMFTHFKIDVRSIR